MELCRVRIGLGWGLRGFDRYGMVQVYYRTLGEMLAKTDAKGATNFLLLSFV